MSTALTSTYQPKLQGVSTVSPLRRNTTIAIGVVALHVAVLWALQSGLMRRVANIVVPEAIMVEILSPAAAPQPAAKPAPALPVPTKPDVERKSAVAAPAPKIATPIPVPTPAPQAPAVLAVAPSAAATPAATAVNTSTATASPSTAAPAAAGAQTAAAAGMQHSEPSPAPPPKVVLPSSDADYLNNAKPAYPPLSKRLGEQGKVVVRVFIDTDGHASQASIKVSSGFDRLDQASLTTALGWRYVPGKRNGTPEGMFFDVPMTWNLK